MSEPFVIVFNVFMGQGVVDQNTLTVIGRQGFEVALAIDHWICNSATCDVHGKGQMTQ